MASQLGYVLGNEARLWGHQVLLGPLMNLVRHPYGGRNFDFPSEDPYLSGVMSVETIKGIQAQGVHAVTEAHRRQRTGNRSEQRELRDPAARAARALPAALRDVGQGWGNGRNHVRL